jgi:hypothetical protein
MASDWQLQRREASIAYSARERRMFDLLRQKRAMLREVSSLDILESWYNGVEKTPYHAREIVNNIVRSLTGKMAANGEPIEIVKSPRAGPRHITFKLARRK